MKSIAIICPIHEAKFDYGRKLLTSFYQCQLNLYADFYFVYSNEDDMRKNDGFEKFLIAPDNLSIRGGVVNQKKLWAVENLSRIGYEYVITVDADFLFIRAVNLMEICEEYF